MNLYFLKFFCWDDCGLYYGHDGQGKIWGYLLVFFRKDHDNFHRFVFVPLRIVWCNFYRRTMRSLKAPIRFKSWKQGR